MEGVMSPTDATGYSPIERYIPQEGHSGPTGPRSASDFEKLQGRSQADDLEARLTNNTGSSNVVPFPRESRVEANDVPADKFGLEKSCKELEAKKTAASKQQNEQPGPVETNDPQPRPSAQQATQRSSTSSPNFDHATALEFYKAVGPSAFILGFKQGRHVTGAEDFRLLTKEADEKHEHLFFHVAIVKATWTSGTTATKDQILECCFLWGDCDAKKYVGNDPTEAARHYSGEGFRISQIIDEGLNRLGITPFAKWRSGAGWQFLVKLDRAISPDEAETLVGKLHTALGFDPVVRNCNRILRVPGSINWKEGKDGRVPLPCMSLRLADAVTKIDDVRQALASVAEPAKEANASVAAEIKIDWSKVKQAGWLKSVADLPDDAPAKLRHIIGHTGNLDTLNNDLIEFGHVTKPYKSWSDVTLAIQNLRQIHAGRNRRSALGRPSLQSTHRQAERQTTCDRASSHAIA
jgi:hypothetical protein